jgi:hypothetical protein
VRRLRRLWRALVWTWRAERIAREIREDAELTAYLRRVYEREEVSRWN